MSEIQLHFGSFSLSPAPWLFPGFKLCLMWNRICCLCSCPQLFSSEIKAFIIQESGHTNKHKNELLLLLLWIRRKGKQSMLWHANGLYIPYICNCFSMVPDHFRGMGHYCNASSVIFFWDNYNCFYCIHVICFCDTQWLQLLFQVHDDNTKQISAEIDLFFYREKHSLFNW